MAVVRHENAFVQATAFYKWIVRAMINKAFWRLLLDMFFFSFLNYYERTVFSEYIPLITCYIPARASGIPCEKHFQTKLCDLDCSTLYFIWKSSLKAFQVNLHLWLRNNTIENPEEENLSLFKRYLSAFKHLYCGKSMINYQNVHLRLFFYDTSLHYILNS